MFKPYHLYCTDLTDPIIGRHYSKMIVYSVLMNLQADFVGGVIFSIDNYKHTHQNSA